MAAHTTNAGPFPGRLYLSAIPVVATGAIDILAAKAGYTPVVLGWALAGTPGKFQSDATTDLTDALPVGTMLANERIPYLCIGEDGKKLNLTAGTGLVLAAYFKTPVK